MVTRGEASSRDGSKPTFVDEMGSGGVGGKGDSEWVERMEGRESEESRGVSQGGELKAAREFWHAP